MIRSLSGEILALKDGYAVMGLSGMGLLVHLNKKNLRRIKPGATTTTLFTHLHVREDAFDIYGFMEEGELDFFELLISVSGVGPKSALAIMEVADLNDLASAIQEGRPDLLTQASGIGRKTAERIIVELKNRVAAAGSGSQVKKMEVDTDLVEALMSLGYRREESREALNKVPRDIQILDARLKAALKLLSKK